MAVNEVHTARENEAITLGLNIITEKTKATVQNRKEMREKKAVHLNNTNIESADSFTYLGSIIHTMKIKRRKFKANTAYFLMINLFKSRAIHSENKIKIYTPTVCPIVC